jgi:EmrB/QacA subfamily drug resistance transporter
MTETSASLGIPQDQEPALDPRRWIALASVLTGLFMILLDLSIVTVAIPAIRDNLGADNADIQFVVAGYGLAYAVMLITGGRLGDLYGRKRLFMVGMGGFVVASALCGLAQSAVMLDLSRVVQGLMAALMYPQVYSVIQVAFPPRERGRAFGLVGAVIGIATITGPLVGGLIIRGDLTGDAWRWIFLVNVPIGIGSLAVASRVVSESRAPGATRLDLTGVALATAALGLLVYPLVQGQSSGWPAWTFTCIALSPVVLAIFVGYERSLPPSRFPLVQLSLFKIPSFRLGVVISAAFLAGVPSFFFVFVLLLQTGLGYSALHAGLTTVPWTAGVAVASILSAKIASRLGKWTIVIGSALLVAGTLGIIYTLHLRGVKLASYDLIPSFLVAGAGLGTVIAPLLNVILGGVPSRDAGSSSGVLTTFQQLGGAIGVAIVGVVFFSLVSGTAPRSVADVTPALRAQLAAQHLPAPAVASAVTTFGRCFDRQASSSDPAHTAPGCPPVSDVPASPASAALDQAGLSAVGHDFASSTERVLFLQVGFWALTGLLAIFLPRARREVAHGG